MLSTTSGDDAARPPEAAPEEPEAHGTAALTKEKREPSCAACGLRAGGPYFGAATVEAVSAQLLLVSALVVILSIAGDAHGSATQARPEARFARAASPEAERSRALSSGFSASSPRSLADGLRNSGNQRYER